MTLRAVFRDPLRDVLRDVIGGASATSITMTANGSPDQVILTDSVASTLQATTDAPVSGVEFFQDGVSIGEGVDQGGNVWELSWTPSGVDYTTQLTAVADGALTSDPVVIVVAEANRISQDLSTWTRTNIASFTTGEDDPMGGTNAVRFVATEATNTQHRITATASIAPSEANSGFEIWASSDGLDVLMIYPIEDSANNFSYVDLGTGETWAGNAYCKIVERRDIGGREWCRIWFSFAEATTGPRNFWLYLCKDLNDNSPDTGPSDAMYLALPRTADGILPLNEYQKTSIYLASVSGSIETWNYTSGLIDTDDDLDAGVRLIDVIKPSGWSSSSSYPCVFALPALIETSENVANIFDAQGYADTYNCVIVVPYFKLGAYPFAWYGSASNGDSNQHEFVTSVLTGFAKEFLSAGSTKEDRLLIGYSKSANGAFSLILRNPEVFGYASGWDGAWDIDWATQQASLGLGTQFTTEAHWQTYDPIQILAANAAGVSDKTRLSLRGYFTWGPDQLVMQTALNAQSIPFSYDRTLGSAHEWNADWLDDAMADLFALRAA